MVIMLCILSLGFGNIIGLKEKKHILQFMVINLARTKLYILFCN